MTLDTTALRNAVLQLEDALAYAGSDLAVADPRAALHLRAGAIQAFEFTYELSVRMLRRALLDSESSSAAVDELDFSGLIRRGYARGLLNEEISVWREFRADRGTTSQACDESQARRVFEAIPRFLTEAKHLLARLDGRPIEDL